LAYHLVAYASDNETLYPGDILGTGAIGLSCSMDLHRWVNVGQTVTFEVEGIGPLTHKIIEGEKVVNYTLKGMDGLLPPLLLNPNHFDDVLFNEFCRGEDLYRWFVTTVTTVTSPGEKGAS
jgi:hypothetical protein